MCVCAILWEGIINKYRVIAFLAASFAVSAASQQALALDGDAGALTPEKADKAFASKPIYSPYAGRTFPTRPLFGDTHLHTH